MAHDHNMEGYWNLVTHGWINNNFSLFPIALDILQSTIDRINVSNLYLIHSLNSVT